VIHNIHSNIASLAVDIDTLIPLENNARRGDVNAIMASYSKFGQVKPIVAVENDSGGLTVIAGNHQLEAARRLGWQQIAVSVADLDSDDALAFALADNRISDMGSTDNDLLYKMLTDVLPADEDFFDALGWDDFSVAAIENSVISAGMANDSNAGWSAPQVVINESAPLPPTYSDSTEEPPSTPLVADPTKITPEASTETIVTQGSTSTASSGVSNASIQFTLVFENAAQQSMWYSFLKWLRESPVYEGSTTTEQLLDFIAQHSERG